MARRGIWRSRARRQALPLLASLSFFKSQGSFHRRFRVGYGGLWSPNMWIDGKLKTNWDSQTHTLYPLGCTLTLGSTPNGSSSGGGQADVFRSLSPVVKVTEWWDSRATAPGRGERRTSGARVCVCVCVCDEGQKAGRGTESDKQLTSRFSKGARRTEWQERERQRRKKTNWTVLELSFLIPELRDIEIPTASLGILRPCRLIDPFCIYTVPDFLIDCRWDVIVEESRKKKIKNCGVSAPRSTATLLSRLWPPVGRQPGPQP